MSECGFVEKYLKGGKIVLVALNGYDIEHVIIPNAIKYVADMGFDKVQLKGLNGVDLTIRSNEQAYDVVERWKQELYKFCGIEL